MTIIKNSTKSQRRYACYKSLVLSDSFEGTFKEFLYWLCLEKRCPNYQYEDWYKKDVELITKLKAEWRF